MKRIIAIFIAFALILSFSACGNKADTDELSTDFDGGITEEATAAPEERIEILSVMSGYDSGYEWNDMYQDYQVWAGCRSFGLSSECAENYPALATALKARSNRLAEDSDNIFDSLVEESADMIAEAGRFVTFESEEKAEFRRADSVVTSLLFYSYSFMGGVHGSYGVTGETYDSQTGELLKLSDVVTDISALPELCLEELKKYYDGIINPDYELDGLFARDEESIPWLLDYHGITFFFNPYELASFGAGILSVTLTYEDYPGLVEEKYCAVPESYGVQLNESVPFLYDVDGNGEFEKINTAVLYLDEDYGEGYIGCEIYLDDEYVEDEGWAFDFDATFVHTLNGDYIYIQYQTDNDYRFINIYSLSQGKIIKVGEKYDPLSHIPYKAGVPNQSVLTDPNNFYTEKNTQLIGTMTACRRSYTGKDGAPESNEELYTAVKGQRLTLTLTRELEFDIMSDMVNVPVDKKTLAKGSRVTYFRTDDEKIAEFILPGGKIGRLELEANGYSHTVDGIDVYDLFSGVFVAG